MFIEIITITATPTATEHTTFISSRGMRLPNAPYSFDRKWWTKYTDASKYQFFKTKKNVQIDLDIPFWASNVNKYASGALYQRRSDNVY